MTWILGAHSWKGRGHKGTTLVIKKKLEGASTIISLRTRMTSSSFKPSSTRRIVEITGSDLCISTESGCQVVRLLGWLMLLGD